MPLSLERAVERKDLDAMRMYDLNTCMECGSCAFVCPAKRPLVQNIRLGKALLREAAAKSK